MFPRIGSPDWRAAHEQLRDDDTNRHVKESGFRVAKREPLARQWQHGSIRQMKQHDAEGKRNQSAIHQHASKTRASAGWMIRRLDGDAVCASCPIMIDVPCPDEKDTNDRYQ